MKSKTRGRRWGSGLLSFGLGGVIACGELLGFEDAPVPSECVSDADCAAGEVCSDFECVSESGGGPVTKLDAPIPDGGVCVPSQGVCLKCDETGHWVNGNACLAACRDDECVLPPSCNGLPPSCGANVNCCRSIVVPGGSYSRGCDEVCAAWCSPPERYPATVSTFSLDVYEVTVGRFRQFVNAYPSNAPREGQGKNPNNPADTGWDPAWSAELPVDRAALLEQLSTGCLGTPTWSAELGAAESKPINCVSWFVAYAFCVWDGGRLPSQAEWNYVATGGDEQRRYPWSAPPESSEIGPAFAAYRWDAPPAGPFDVGSFEQGKGKWGHHDLAGNVGEWVLDSYMNCYATPSACRDCADIAEISAYEKVHRGGSFLDVHENLEVALRSGVGASDRYPNVGFRCARDL